VSYHQYFVNFKDKEIPMSIPRRAGRSALVLTIALAVSGPAKAQDYDPNGYPGYYDYPYRDNYLYRGLGYYRFVPPAIANPKVIIPSRAITPLPARTGPVGARDERPQSIAARLPAETVEGPHGPSAQSRAVDGDSPENMPDIHINVSRYTITVIGPRTGERRPFSGSSAGSVGGSP
jgi:hypothetical protein